MKKIIAIIMVAVIMALAASCTQYTILVQLDGVAANGNTATQPAATTPADTTPADTTPADTTAAPAADTTAAPSGDSTATTAAPAADTTAAPAASTGAPSTKEEIIAYYVAAYNKIGTDNGKITRTYDYTSNYNNILNINNNSTLEKLANSLMKQFMVESTDALETSFADLPPKGVSTLAISPSLISDASCKDNGSTYTIVLKSTGTDANYEIDSQPGVGSAGVIGPLLRTEDVSGAAGSLLSFEGLHAWYATASVTATVDKATGHITDFYFNTPCVLHFDQVKVAVLKVQNCDIGLLFEQRYTIAY